MFFAHSTFAATTQFRSAQIITTDGPIPYVNLTNCSATDGLTCDRAKGFFYANLYFNDFGTYEDFGIPQGATITKVRIRVTGKSVGAAPYVGLSNGTTFTAGCQFPPDLWRLTQLVNSNVLVAQTFVTNVTDLSFWPQTVLAYCLRPYAFENKSFIFRIRFSSFIEWSANIDNFEIALDYDPPLTTPTPTPTPVQPFLDLPWDHESQGKTFDEVAFNPNSWFDHEYPLQNIPCCTRRVMKFTGKTEDDFYRSHNGYDYGSDNDVILNTPVLAAASGWATFKSWQNSGGAGNVIKIDHGNGYQTWYEHLSKDDLVVATEGAKLFVNNRQQIGKVGMTGNTTGAHIHFSVFKDTNNNGNFDDDIPWGVTDPLGWKGKIPDPWPLWSQGGRNGAASHNLFIARSSPKTDFIASSGGTLNGDKATVVFPAGAFIDELIATFEQGPFETIANTIRSIVPSFFLQATDSSGQPVTGFLKPVTITYNYKNANLFNINENSLSLYSFNEQTKQWDILPTLLDTTTKTASAQTTHFSQFALMGEVQDLTPPTTEVAVSGEKGKDNWYRSDVVVELNGNDNEDGVDLQYTLYTLNDNDWFEYETPLVFEKEGSYKITYQSIDKAENKEERQSVELQIDKTTPEAKMLISQDKQALTVEGIDQNTTFVDKSDTLFTVSDLAGNTLVMDIKEKEESKRDTFSIYSLQYNQHLPTVLADNRYRVRYGGKKDAPSVNTQAFEIDKEIVIRIQYDREKNQSAIFTKVYKKEKVEEVKDGLILLQIKTNQGKLEYSY